MCFSLFIIVLRSLNTTIERTTSNARHTVRDGDGGKARATIGILNFNVVGTRYQWQQNHSE